jgi:hypothetical protein
LLGNSEVFSFKISFSKIYCSLSIFFFKNASSKADRISVLVNFVLPFSLFEIELFNLPDYNKKEKFVDTVSNKNNFIKTVLSNDKEIILPLVNAFTRLYPLMSLEIEKILPKQFRFIFKDQLKDEPSAIEQRKKAMEEQAELMLQKSTPKDNNNKNQISKIYKYNYY